MRFFFDPNGIFFKNLGFLGEIFEIQNQTKDADLTRSGKSNKKLPQPKFF